ncbi:MAG: feruloyl-CoA synthase [Betaproteobacteria bacterium]|nr:feruloyl-CoA synthase [Betaproteobacteria bacterium]
MSTLRYREVLLGSADLCVEKDARGHTLLRSAAPLGAYPDRLTERLLKWASEAPERTFIARRDASGAWRRISYREALANARALGQALLERGLSAERPLVILSENDLEHAVLALAALHVGVPYVAVSPAYSLVSQDLGKLHYILQLLTPGLVYASDGARYARAIAAVSSEVELAVGATPFAQLAATRPSASVEAAHAAIRPDAVAKFLLTSGSTGMPKAAIQTQRMLTSNLQMVVDCLPFLRHEPPVLVDWLPWNHVFGGNHNFGITLYNGGTFYIDDGKPTPQLMGETIRNLREIAPTVYFNVPRGFEELVPYLQREPALRDHFFSRVKMLFFAGAGLAQPVWDALDALAVQSCGERILWVSGLGATETAPSVTFTRGPGVRSGMIGLPVPGVDVKLAPVEGKLEIRARGPSIMPGYWRQPELTRAAFDEDGYYRLGDAVRWVDYADHAKGLLFDGRIAEDFKLSSGTWASVGPLRARFIAEGAPYVQDVVVAGINRDWISVLVFPRFDDCRRLCPDLPAQAPAASVLRHPAVRAQFQLLLDRLAAQATGGANRIARALLLDVPPSIDVGEVTDKGSINQRAVLEHRADLVEALYAEPPLPEAICAALTPC